MPKGNINVYRKCTSCHRILPLTEKFFHRDRSRSFGFKYKCRECCRAKKLGLPVPEPQDQLTQLERQVAKLKEENKRLNKRYQAAKALWSTLLSWARDKATPGVVPEEAINKYMELDEIPEREIDLWIK